MSSEGVGLEWPHLKWSADSRFFARQTPDTISVYQVPDCGLLDKKSIKCPGIRRFLWSPKDNIISYWVPEQGEAPARVTLMKLPQRNVINIFQIKTLSLPKYLRIKIRFYEEELQKSLFWVGSNFVT